MIKKASEKLNKLAFAGLVAYSREDFNIVKPQTGETGLDPRNVVVRFIEWALFFVGAIALIFVIYGGILLVTAGGNADQAKKGRDTLLYAILGIIVVVLAFGIVRWATGFGTNTLN